MNIRKEHAEKFKKLYEKTFSEKITIEEASEQCLKLVLLVSAVYESMTLEDFKRVQAIRRQAGNL